MFTLVMSIAYSLFGAAQEIVSLSTHLALRRLLRDFDTSTTLLSIVVAMKLCMNLAIHGGPQ